MFLKVFAIYEGSAEGKTANHVFLKYSTYGVDLKIGYIIDLLLMATLKAPAMHACSDVNAGRQNIILEW